MVAGPCRARLRRLLALQWGHGREAMDGVRGVCVAAERPALQWGHGREAMDGRLAENMHGHYRGLQWGHGREAMDGFDKKQGGRPYYYFNGAMAVRPWMAVAASTHRRACSYFNGAMAVRPWMAFSRAPPMTPLQELQWGHGREAMDGEAPRTGDR